MTPQLTSDTILKFDICKAAVDQANYQARTELLNEGALGPILAQISSQSLSILRENWTPFKVYNKGDTGYGMELQIESDPLARAALIRTNTYDRIREIGIQAFQDAFMEDENFVTILLTRLFND